MDTKTKIDEYITKHPKWIEEMNLTRSIFDTTELEPNVKWGIPTYSIGGKNVVSFAGFKNHFAVWFQQGVFLTDPQKILSNAQEGKTKGMRNIKYTTEDKIDPEVLKSYVLEAIQNQKDGKVIKIERTKKKAIIPSQFFLDSLAEASALEKFEELSRARQNDYVEYLDLSLIHI